MFVGCPIFVRQGRAQKHTPHKTTRRGRFMFVGCPIFGRQGRAQKHTPHKTTRQGRIQDDGKGQIFTGRRIQHERRRRCPLAPTSFSCLDARKGCEKKIKASGMPANLAGYLIFSLFIFRFLLSRVGAQKHTPHKRPEGGGFKTMGRVKFLQAGAFNMKGGGVAPSPLHPFLALMQEKDAKRKSRPHRGQGIWPGT